VISSLSNSHTILCKSLTDHWPDYKYKCTSFAYTCTRALVIVISTCDIEDRIFLYCWWEDPPAYDYFHNIHERCTDYVSPGSTLYIRYIVLTYQTSSVVRLPRHDCPGVAIRLDCMRVLFSMKRTLFMHPCHPHYAPCPRCPHLCSCSKHQHRYVYDRGFAVFSSERHACTWGLHNVHRCYQWKYTLYSLFIRNFPYSALWNVGAITEYLILVAVISIVPAMAIMLMAVTGVI